jgi:hypothetical protein
LKRQGIISLPENAPFFWTILPFSLKKVPKCFSFSFR